MGWKARAEKVYEARVVGDSLARLARRLDLKALPLSKDELHTLAKRARESFYGSKTRKERLAKYIAHLSALHGHEPVRSVSAALEQINNEIGYEEK